MWKLTIIRENNGYILEGKSEESSVKERWVIEDNDDILKSHEELLWEVINYFNFGGSKHDKERIRIIRE